MRVRLFKQSEQSEQSEHPDDQSDEPMALTVVAVPTRYTNTRGKRKGTVSHRWRYVLELHLCGKPVHEIAKMTGYSPMTIYGILNKEDVIGLRQQIMQQFDKEFEALYPKVVNSIRAGLDHPHPDVQKEARRDWLKAHGKYRDTGEPTQQVFSAEKMVVQILQQAKDEQAEQLTHAD